MRKKIPHYKKENDERELKIKRLKKESEELKNSDGGTKEMRDHVKDM